MAYEQIAGPIGHRRDDYLASLVAFHVVNVMRDSKKGRTLSIQDFLPRWGTTAEEVGFGDVQESADPAGGGG